MSHRLYVPIDWCAGTTIALPEGATRHTQVLRLQPGDAVVLFNGRGGEWLGRVAQMARGSTVVEVIEQVAVERELPTAVTLAVGMPANDRMDWLVEKAAELGVAAIQPLECSRSVLRLQGERASKRVAHWQAIAVAACEQSGRTAVPEVRAVLPLLPWLAAGESCLAPSGARWVLSLREARPLGEMLASQAGLVSACFLSGPEGGLSEEEERAAREAGFAAVSLGPRTLRADTAPLAALAAVGCCR